MKKILLIVLIVIVGLVLVKDQVIKQGIIFGAGKIMGTPAKLDYFSLSLIKQKVQIKGFQLYNPPGFPREVFVDIPEISVSLQARELLKGNLHFPVIVINLKELVVYKNQMGKLNVDSLKFVQQKKDEPPPAKKQPQKASKAMPFHIDSLKLNVGKVVMKDYSSGSAPTTQVFDVGIKNKVYKDIDSVQQMSALILVEAMRPTAIKNAAVYGVANMLGVAFLPAGVAGMLLQTDTAEEELPLGMNQFYPIALAVVKEMGTLNSEDATSGIIKANVQGCSVTVKLQSTGKDKTLATVSARKMLLPKPEIASGVLFNISEKLK